MAKKRSSKARIITLGKIRDKRGNLSVIQAGKGLPFEIARTYWIYDVPGGEHRGGHAYYMVLSCWVIGASCITFILYAEKTFWIPTLFC